MAIPSVPAAVPPNLVPSDHPLANAIQYILTNIELTKLRLSNLEENQKNLWKLLILALSAILGVQITGAHI